MQSTAHGAGSLDWLMTNFVWQVPDTQRAVTVSTDGLRLAFSADLSVDVADHLAVVISGLASLTNGATRYLATGGIRQTIVDMDDAVLPAMTGGHRAVVGVLAAADCDLGQVGYKTAMLVHRVDHSLNPAARTVTR